MRDQILTSVFIHEQSTSILQFPLKLNRKCVIFLKKLKFNKSYKFKNLWWVLSTENYVQEYNVEGGFRHRCFL